MRKYRDVDFCKLQNESGRQIIALGQQTQAECGHWIVRPAEEQSGKRLLLLFARSGLEAVCTQVLK